MKRKILALALALALCLGLVPAGLAYTTPDFKDVPANNWAYKYVMEMADAGIIKGTGDRQFSPESKVSAAMLLTLVGRVTFPDLQDGAGADWAKPYVEAAQNAGWLEGTNIDPANTAAEVTRYDMAVILAKASKKLGISEKSVDTSKIKDYGEIPNKYSAAVIQVYGNGLINGDGNGNFSGASTMRRNEAAAVMSRLIALKPGGSTATNPGNTSTEPENPADTPYTLTVGGGYGTNGVLVPGEKVIIPFGVEPSSTAAPYGNDRTGFIHTSSDPSVLEITGKASSDFDHWYVTAHREGTATITVTDPYGVTASRVFTVVSAREGLGTKTYAVSVTMAWQERHSLRGNAYTEMDFIPDVPYKIYYTRDGGKTSQVVYEGVAPSDVVLERIELELPEDSFYSRDAGLYISGEAMLNGQRLVTSDLRTDGRAYARVVKGITAISESSMTTSRLEFLLTPPTGEKAKFTIKGAITYGLGGASRVGEGFTVQLHLKDGRVLAETTTEANGRYTLDCEVDAIDNGFDVNIEQYYVTASGILNGVPMKSKETRLNGELALYSLDFIGGNPYSSRNVSWYVDVFSVE